MRLHPSLAPYVDGKLGLVTHMPSMSIVQSPSMRVNALVGAVVGTALVGAEVGPEVGVPVLVGAEVGPEVGAPVDRQEAPESSLACANATSVCVVSPSSHATTMMFASLSMLTIVAL